MSANSEPTVHIIAVETTISLASAWDKIHEVIPKSIVTGFNGAEVTFKSHTELYKYIKTLECQITDNSL